MSRTTPPRDRHTPTTDEQIQAYTVGEIKPYAVKVVIVEYDPAWPAYFTEEAARIRGALGVRAVRVEHKGSTAVPGLAAKPIIDIGLAVEDSSDESTYVPALEAAGYQLCIREPEWHQHRVFQKRLRLGHDRDVNLHVYTTGCAEFERDLIFRDWLRSHPDDRQRYEDTKRELAKKDWKYVQNYADAKTEVIDDIVGRAGEPKAPCRTH